MPTLLCVPILVQDTLSALRDAQAARDADADLVEFRIDDIFHGDPAQEQAVTQIVNQSPLPCIVTCRSSTEGGHYDGPDDARISVYERLGTAFGPGEQPPRYLDLELSTWQRSANIRQKIKLAIEHPEQIRNLATSLIISTHDFKGRPADLTRRVLAMRQTPAKVLKVAFLARSLRDNLELFDLLADRDRPTIALGMGEFGLMSRVLAPKFGGFLTFASLRADASTAPGQPSIRELLGLYRFRSIGPATAVYGVVGHPVSHSLSPHIHNAGFAAIGHDGVYIPLPIAPGYEPLKATLLELIAYTPLNLRGLSITLPHKESLVRLAREQGWQLDPAAAATSAANTLAIDRDAHGNPTLIRVLNTDIPALVGSLEQEIGSVAGKRIAIIGAGGVGKAAAMGLAAAGASITIFNRTRARADALAAQISPLAPSPAAGGGGAERSEAEGAPRAAGISALTHFGFDAYINCTPLGMKGGSAPDACPIPIADVASISPRAVVMDTIYNPIETPLLHAARAAGLKTIPGLPMFIAQAAAQFTLWTGKPAPVAPFERSAREQLV